MNQIAGKIRKASPSDLQSVLQLLELNGLPTDGLQQHLHLFLVWEIYQKDSAESHIGGCVGLELYGKDALLRSLSVYPHYQGKGIGTLLLNSISSQAEEKNIENLFLLTTTVDNYFERHHFSRIKRDDAPPGIKESEEFSSICPSTAICMTKKLIK